MVSKFATALMAGMFFTFFLDFFFFLGLFLNYIESQNIDVYYNILFADHQSPLLFLLGVVIFGYLFIFLKNTKVGVVVFVISFAIINLTLIPSIGKSAGEMMFEQKNKIIKEGSFTYIGHIVYEGRSTVWFYDDELQKIIEIKKDNINE